MEAIFKALADPARLTLMDSLRQKDGQTLTELEAHLEMSRFGVMKHLRVLEDASLIITRKEGRFKYHYLNAIPLQGAIDRWIEPYRAKPAVRAILDLKSQLESGSPQPSKPPAPERTTCLYVKSSTEQVWTALLTPDHFLMLHPQVSAVTGSLELGQTCTLSTSTGQPLWHIICLTRQTPTELRLQINPAAEPDPWHVTLSLTAEATHTHLSSTLHGAPSQAQSVDDWHRMLSALKTLLETGAPHRFPRAQPPT